MAFPCGGEYCPRYGFDSLMKVGSMIREDTAPGTKVVAIAVDGLPPELPNVIIGEVYTVDFMVDCQSGCVGVVLQEHPQPREFGIAYERWAFRYLDLPECLTKLQTVDNISMQELIESGVR